MLEFPIFFDNFFFSRLPALNGQDPSQDKKGKQNFPPSLSTPASNTAVESLEARGIIYQVPYLV